MKKIKEAYTWETDMSKREWMRQYPLLNEDDNWFYSKSDAISWIEAQKELDPFFGEGECFLLIEMFFI